MNINDLTIKLYADGIDIFQSRPFIKGFTTNPTLMRKGNIPNYERWAKAFVAHTNGLPVSFEVLADDFENMERQARVIASWGPNVYVKIPITNTRGVSTNPLTYDLLKSGVQVNVTAITAYRQVDDLLPCLDKHTSSIVSVFAGRIADTGADPVPYMRDFAQTIRHDYPATELLWASTREIINIVQAMDAGCHIITLPEAVLGKLDWFGRNLKQVSLDTVKQFYDDALAAGYTL